MRLQKKKYCFIFDNIQRDMQCNSFLILWKSSGVISQESRLFSTCFFITHPKKRCHHIIIIIISITVIKVGSDFHSRCSCDDDGVMLIILIKFIFIKALHLSSPYSTEMCVTPIYSAKCKYLVLFLVPKKKLKRFHFRWRSRKENGICDCLSDGFTLWIN